MTAYQDFLPASGSKVRLIKAPRGSYASNGDVVRVTYAPTRRKGVKVIHSQTQVRIWDEERDCGTCDATLFWRWAQWELVAE